MSCSPDPDLVSRVAAVIVAQSGCSQADALAQARGFCDLAAPLSYSPWRHGGSYVHRVRYLSGACGCVSRNYSDRKWRIACDQRADPPTFRSRDEAARAEQMLALSQYTPEVVAREISAAEAKEAARQAEVAARLAAAQACRTSELLEVLRGRSAFNELAASVRSLYDQLERTGAMSAEGSRTAYLACLVRRDLAAIELGAKGTEEVAFWRSKLEDLAQ